MAEREIPLNSMRVKIVNIVLYPSEKQNPDEYARLFKAIYNDKRTVKTFGDRHTRIRSLYVSESNYAIYGDFSNTSHFDPESKALDTTTNEIIPSNLDPKKGLGLKNWRYFFFPEYHRLVFDAANTSERQVLKFLDEAIGFYLMKSEYAITIEKDRQQIEQIIKSTSLTRLFVRISYSNNDNISGWEKIIDDELRNSDSKTAKSEFIGSVSRPIKINASNLIKGFLRLSASNGYAEAIESKKRGKAKLIKTEDHPLVERVEFREDPIRPLAQLLNFLFGKKEK